MSETIPYNYSTPIPFYFQDNGWLSNSNPGKKNRIFIQWAFGQSKCCDQKVMNNGHEIWLSPFEILYTWKKCENECGLSWKESRRRIEKCSQLGILVKNEEKSTQWWTVYRWNDELLTKKRATKKKLEKEEKDDRQHTHDDDLEKQKNQKKQKRATRIKKGQPEGQPKDYFTDKKGQPDLGEETQEKGQPRKILKKKKGQPEGQHSSRTSVFSISKDIDKTTTTKNEFDESSSLSSDAKSIKEWLDREASRPRQRKQGRQRIPIYWHSRWFIPLQKFEFLIRKYGSNYVLDQAAYMVRAQVDFDEGRRTMMKTEIQIPESFLSSACNDNYAESLNKKETK